MQTTSDIRSHAGLAPRILIVDDEPTIVEEIVESLALQSVDAHGVSNAYDALAALLAEPEITVLLTDINMPELSGLELTERALAMRSDENALEVVMLTAYANMDFAVEALRAGAADFVRKPIRLATLKATLDRAHRKALRRRSLHRTNMARLTELRLDAEKMQAGLVEARAAANDDGRAAFLSMISHEMRTPLNPIIGFSQLIEQKSASLDRGELKEYARYIREAGESLFGLTESMLKLIELRSRPPRILKCWEDASEILERLRDGQRTAALALSHLVEIDCPAEQRAFTDGELLLQALEHLLSNAIKFSTEGAPISLSLRTNEQEMVFTVSDQGPGMTAQEVSRALKPFESLNLSFTRSHGGLGLGLPLASLLAQHLDGRLAIESIPGRGTAASICIPTRQPASA